MTDSGITSLCCVFEICPLMSDDYSYQDKRSLIAVLKYILHFLLHT